MNRGADRQDIFGHDRDFERFERLLGEVVATHRVEVHAYCLMTNHFHLLMHCPNAGLSDAMQLLQRQYTQWYNVRYGRDGSLYRGRFHSVLVDSDEQLWTVGRYIHRNPLALLPIGALAAYRWSSYGVYTHRRVGASWLSTEWLVPDVHSGAEAYRRFVEAEWPSDVPPVLQRRPVGLDAVIDAVAHAAATDGVNVRQRARGSANAGRLIAIALAVELRVASYESIAEAFGLSGPASVRALARRGRVAVASERSFTELRERALDVVYGDELLRGA
jgi:REP element-mobilizing transposase RayT